MSNTISTSILARLRTKNWKPSLEDKAKAEAELELRRRRRKRDAELEARRAAWRVQPDLYASERLNLDLTEPQVQILYSILNNRRTAVKAHHSLGKTFIAAVALLWWIDCWQAHICYVTAPTWGQALGLTFKQAKRLAMVNNLDFQILDSGLIRDRDKFKQTERFAKALNAENGEGFQGEHTAPMLILVEEAVGVPRYIFDASEGLMTHPDCRLLEIANPTDEATQFGEHCESASYQVFSFSALEHPNIAAELACQPAPFEGAVRLQWLYEQVDKECETVDILSEDCFEFYALEEIKRALNGHAVTPQSRKAIYKPTAFFQGRVLGEFPTEASSKVIPAGWLKSLPLLEINKLHKIQIGCDVARFGDDRTTIFARCGSVVLTAKEIRKFDNLEVAAAVKDVATDVCRILELPPEDALRIEINLDVTGGLGTGPFDLLNSEDYNVVGINSSAAPDDAELYRNVRSELWFMVRDRAKDKNLDLSRLDLDVRRKLQKELTAPEYKIRGGKKVVEEKDETKKRLGASPDLADGFNLAFYEPVRFERAVKKSESYQEYW